MSPYLLPTALREPAPDTIGRAAVDLAETRRLAEVKAALQPEITAYFKAAFLAKKLYPEPIARVVGDELREWADWGHRWGVSVLVAPLYEQVMADARERGLA